MLGQMADSAKEMGGGGVITVTVSPFCSLCD